jgi:hypothetical protein
VLGAWPVCQEAAWKLLPLRNRSGAKKVAQKPVARRAASPGAEQKPLWGFEVFGLFGVLGPLGFGVLGFEVFGVLGFRSFELLGFGILGFGGHGFLGSGLLGFGVPGFVSLGFGFLGFGVLGF